MLGVPLVVCGIEETQQFRRKMLGVLLAECGMDSRCRRIHLSVQSHTERRSCKIPARLFGTFGKPALQ